MVSVAVPRAMDIARRCAPDAFDAVLLMIEPAPLAVKLSATEPVKLAPTLPAVPVIVPLAKIFPVVKSGVKVP